MNLPTSFQTPPSARAAAARDNRRTLDGRVAHLRDLVARGLYRLPTDVLAECLLRRGALGPFAALR